MVPLARVRDAEPDKTSTREALGRALFGSQRYAEAAVEFEAVVERAPTNDYALFCLGRSLQQLGRHQDACKPLALACCLRPERSDYRLYRDRSRARQSLLALDGWPTANARRRHPRTDRGLAGDRDPSAPLSHPPWSVGRPTVGARPAFFCCP